MERSYEGVYLVGETTTLCKVEAGDTMMRESAARYIVGSGIERGAYVVRRKRMLGYVV
jgi:hypothetical protein